MGEASDSLQYLEILARRWRLVAAAAGAAILLSLGVSLALPKKYTAVCKVLIEPPAGSDLRAAMVLSPIYLESLRTFEHFAESESFFRDAMEKFHLRRYFGARSIEGVQKSVLKVEIVRNTRILEISATLPDPAVAHDLAVYIGERAVSLNRTTVDEGNRDVAQVGEGQLAEARQKLDRTEAAWGSLIASEPITGLSADIEAQQEERAHIARQLLTTEADLAEYAARPSAQTYTQDFLRDANVRAAALRKQLAVIDDEIARKQRVLAERVARRDRLDAERKATQAAFTSIDNRVREMRGDLSYRGERLRVIDPGVVPERPSSPNVPLNVMAAFLLALAAALTFVLLEAAYSARRPESRRGRMRVAGD